MTMCTNSSGYPKMLLNQKNRKLKIYREKKTYFLLEGLVDRLYDILKKIMDLQVDVAGPSGANLKHEARKYLEGWDFKELATEYDTSFPGVATLRAYGKGWVDFTRAIHAITLFGRGFSDIIQPSRPWAKLPKHKYYLATCVSDLKEIMDMDANPDANLIAPFNGYSLLFNGNSVVSIVKYAKEMNLWIFM
ncbi:hypothetical protein K469DRAFT_692110 [Zopfia rhizophila CBS 207.26]|uniref:Uncharacterized protein n=1 Tax=Zopfia rhizophila CBS 207.26 TaxID=1314779 RepID=A0A6A6DSN9_9PEZI|nr:hypothetical protein K469DRAFT_692110 [Zopfia rhizophila CBS 207.26]